MANGKQLSQKGTDFILDLMDSYIDVKEAVTPCVVRAVNPVDDTCSVRHCENFLEAYDVAREFLLEGLKEIEVLEEENVIPKENE